MVDAVTIANSGVKLSLDKIRNFVVRPDDVFLITYPKSGTTWSKEIIPLVLNRGDIGAIQDVPPDLRVPYLEFALSADDDETFRRIQRELLVPDHFDINKLKSPRIIATHLRQEFLPKDLLKSSAKKIYVARNPKDVAVSCYHFLQMILEQVVINDLPTSPYQRFQDYLTDFMECRGRPQHILYDGSLWSEHVLPWWHRRHDTDVLFLKYEDMFKDLNTSIGQIASFLDVNLDTDIIEKITNHCSFQSMKRNKMALKANYCVNRVKVEPEKNSPFVRKGGVGGWKNYLTVADNELFDEVYNSWVEDTDLEMTFHI